MTFINKRVNVLCDHFIQGYVVYMEDSKINVGKKRRRKKSMSKKYS